MINSLFLQERRQLILDDLKRDGRVSVKTLSEKLKVSEVTIRPVSYTHLTLPTILRV